MPYYLLLTRSITHAQRISGTLEKVGIAAPFFRPPMALTSRGCGYAVRISDKYLSDAIRLLRPAGLEPVRIYYQSGNGAFKEITRF